MPRFGLRCPKPNTISITLVCSYSYGSLEVVIDGAEAGKGTRMTEFSPQFVIYLSQKMALF